MTRWMHIAKIAGVLVAAALAAGMPVKAQTVPAAYADLYQSLKASLDGYEATLNGRLPPSPRPVVYATELLVAINGTAAPRTAYKGAALVVAKGDALKAMLPKSVIVQVAVVNPDGTQSPPVSYAR